MCPPHQTPDEFSQAWEDKAPCLPSGHSPHCLERKLRTTPLGPGLLIPSLELAAPRDNRKVPECQA